MLSPTQLVEEPVFLNLGVESRAIESLVRAMAGNPNYISIDNGDGAEPGLQADQRLVDRAWLRIGIGLAVAGQAMVFSLGLNITPAGGGGGGSIGWCMAG